MIENIQTWYMGLNTNEQTFWAIAIVASLIFLVQAVLTLIGMDVDADMDIDFTDGDTMDTGGAVSLFSIRSLVNFFFGFGWAGLTFMKIISQPWLVYFASFLVGISFSLLYIFIRRKLQKLERNGAMRIQDCVGKMGSVYLRIPANAQGMGKVQISINGSIHELDAKTDGPELKTGTQVVVVSISGNVLNVQSCK